ncbi:predicted protein [Postia placenta Mad-698-R]|nr:predicted protein [Postia placenta Mad-698-R]
MRKDLGKTWADAYYEKSAGGVQVYPDWAAFATALEEAFPEHGTRIKAHQILMKLPERQKNKKTALSLGNYVTRFEQLASKAQLKDAEVNGVNRTENDYHTLHANFRARTSGTSSDAIKAEDRACSGLGHILIYDYTKIRVIEPEAAPAVSPDINSHASLEAITRPPKRKRCANTTVDEVCVKRRRLSDSPSDASQLKDGIPFGPHPRCMITGFVSAEVEACYILPPDTPQPLFDVTSAYYGK